MNHFKHYSNVDKYAWFGFQVLNGIDISKYIHIISVENLKPRDFILIKT